MSKFHDASSKRKEGLTMIQCSLEYRDLLKTLAEKAEMTQLNYLHWLINSAAESNDVETPDSTPAEREVDQKIRSGDFSESRRGRPKEPRVEVSPTGKWLEPTWNDWKTWQQMRQDGSWEAYIVAYLAAHGREFDGDDFWRSNQTFLMKNAGRLRG